MCAKVVRLWVFEGFEGLKFNDDGNVSGLDQDLVGNVSEALDAAGRHGLKAYLCLLNSWDDRISKGKKPRIRDIVSDDVKKNCFTENALRPFFASVPKENVFAIDVMNEPEGLHASVWRRLLFRRPHLSDTIKFIDECASEIRKHADVKVSCGFQYWKTVKKNSGKLTNLDFYDFHRYDDKGDLPEYEKLGIEKPCIIGEYGQKSMRFDDDLQEKSTGSFLREAWDKGYAGALAWSYHYKGPWKEDRDNCFSLIRSDGEWRPASYEIQKFSKLHEKDIMGEKKAVVAKPLEIPKVYGRRKRNKNID